MTGDCKSDDNDCQQDCNLEDRKAVVDKDATASCRDMQQTCHSQGGYSQPDDLSFVIAVTVGCDQDILTKSNGIAR